MNLSQAFRRSYLLVALGVAGLASACASSSSEDTQRTETQTAALRFINEPTRLETCSVPAPGTRPDPTMALTDAAVLAKFPLLKVMDQLVTLNGTGAAQTGTQLYQQLWDSLDTNANAAFPGTPHCDDAGAINGFPIHCAPPNNRPEVALKTSTTAAFKPVALMNRFDLAPADGTHCGEYRIVYAKESSAPIGGRDFIIFEGALPNPNPRCGIESCRPVVDFWKNLASLPANSTALADAVDSFYFKGLPGFEPVVHPTHYGATGGSGYGAAGAGQIRLNLFANFRDWQLREHHLVQSCSKPLGPVLDLEVAEKRPINSPNCRLVMAPVTVKSNPFASLFSSSFADPRAAAFQADFPLQVSGLAGNDINRIGLGSADTFNAGQSRSQVSSENYATITRSPAFSSAIQAAAVSAGTTLTDSDIVRRANTQSCAGCHQTSVGAPMGGGMGNWPDSLGFVHIDESSNLSPALWCTFIPFRKTILDAFASSPVLDCATSLSKGAQSNGKTVAGKAPGAN